MDFQDQIKQLASKVEKMLPQVHTEEATKNALIMPFIQILGYDVFDPSEVCPEFTADLGIKKGEKVDYAIFLNGKPIILIECKHHNEKLDPHNSQLFRYFHVSEAKFGLLTNGKLYRFYTDINETNKMDEKPFFEFDITQTKEAEIEELKKFHRSYYNEEEIFNVATDLKYSREIKAILNQEFKGPSQAFVKHFVSQVYDGKATQKVLDQFTVIVKNTLNIWAGDMINERLKTALNKNESEQDMVLEEMVKPTNGHKVPEQEVTTTEEEKEGFLIVKSIIRQRIPVERVNYRDAKTYFAILLDDNNRKPLCRLWFNGKTKHIGIFDLERKEVKYAIESLDDIYLYTDQILATASLYTEKAED